MKHVQSSVWFSHVLWAIWLAGSLGLLGDAKKERELLGPDFVLSLEEVQKLDERAQTHLREGESVQAIELYKTALKITEKSLGSDHRDVAHLLLLLATAYRAQADYEQGLALLHRSREISEKALGPDHPMFAAALNEEPGTVEDVYEPFLMKLGFLNRTPAGRIATRFAYEHLRVPTKTSLL